MAIAAIEHPTSVHLLADAVSLLRAASRLGPPAVDPVSAGCLRALVRDLVASARDLEESLTPAPPAPSPLAVVPCAEAGGGRTARPGSLQLSAEHDEVRLRGRGPAGEGDLVRAALHRRAGAPGTDAQQRLGAQLWTALVALSRDGLDPPTAVPTPLGLVDRPGQG